MGEEHGGRHALDTPGAESRRSTKTRNPENRLSIHRQAGRGTLSPELNRRAQSPELNPKARSPEPNPE